MTEELRNILVAISGPALIIGVASIIAFRHEIRHRIADAWLFLSDRETWRQRNRPDRLDRAELLKILLGLDESSRDRLFELYRERYGAGRAKYAKRTYLKWKSGDVRPVRATFNRFAIEMPRVMSFDLKCEILRTLVNEFAPKETVRMTVTLDDWEEKVEPIVERLIARCYTADLPAEVERRLRWLGDDDMRAAAEILKQSRAAESRLAVSMLRDEFYAIERLFDDPGVKPVITHEIKLPCGTISLTIRK